MSSFCTKSILFLAIVMLLGGTVACTQSKPAVPTPTVVQFVQTPFLPSSATETPNPFATQPVAQTTPTDTPVIVIATETSVTTMPTPTLSFPPTSVPTPTTAATAVPSTSGCPSKYVVQKGDWIYQIARNLQARGCNVSAKAIIAANPGINPDNVVPGTTLTIPAP